MGEAGFDARALGTGGGGGVETRAVEARVTRRTRLARVEIEGKDQLIATADLAEKTLKLGSSNKVKKNQQWGL